ENPFPAVCGRICPHNCESECTRGDIDEPVAIDEVKKFIARKDLESEHRFVPEKWNSEGKKIAVIGSGPAGLSCAYYLAVLGHQVTVFEKEAAPGGMMRFGIPSFRLEKDIVDAEIDIIRELGVEIRCDVEVGRDITLDDLRAEGYRGFYVAIGLQSGGSLRIEGEDAEGAEPGISLMKRVNGGEDVKLNGRVAVIGGGNIACDVARTAVRCGAESVDMYCLEGYEEMPCGAEDRTDCEMDGVKIQAGWGPLSIGKEGNKCSALTLRRCLSVKDGEGRFAPVFDDKDTTSVKADYVFYCIGQRTDWGSLLEGTKVELNPNGTAKADGRTYQTAQPDVFVGGDAYTGQKFCIDAIAAGKEGADSLHRYVWEGHSLTLGRVPRDNFHYIDKENVDFKRVEREETPRQKPALDESKRLSFRDGRCALTEEQVKKETARCLSCGAARVDENICIGCGLCTTRCKFDAISLHREFDAWGVPYEKLVGHVVKDTLKKVGRAVTRKD
ncbi:MAG: FAD-dependent oxidoreductase, partial [Oscillospiraceae bacterium]|nr:FAD-dependent oxidoreductase [Oscillospiraceae bacterium]